MTGRVSPPYARLRETVAPGDAVAVRELVAATGFFSAAEIEIAEELVLERLGLGEASDYYFLMADDPDSGELLAYVCHGPRPNAPGVFDLYWIATRPGSQGRGLGAWLLGEAEGRVAAMGGRRVLIETSCRPLYAPTRRFYEKHGYAEIERVPNHYGPGDDMLVYEKDVAAAGKNGTRPGS